MARKSKPGVDRRKFLAGAAVAGAASAIPAVGARAQNAAQQPTAAFVKRPSTAAAEAEMAGNVPAAPGTLSGPPGSDFMVDVLKSLDIEYVASCPGSTFRGIHESIINYGNNTKPEFITTLHEDTAAGRARPAGADGFSTTVRLPAASAAGSHCRRRAPSLPARMNAKNPASNNRNATITMGSCSLNGGACLLRLIRISATKQNADTTK